MTLAARLGVLRLSGQRRRQKVKLHWHWQLLAVRSWEEGSDTLHIVQLCLWAVVCVAGESDVPGHFRKLAEIYLPRCACCSLQPAGNNLNFKSIQHKFCFASSSHPTAPTVGVPCTMEHTALPLSAFAPLVSLPVGPMVSTVHNLCQSGTDLGMDPHTTVPSGL